MANILTSEAVFRERGKECGLSDSILDCFKGQNITCISALAHCVTGTSPPEHALRKLINPDQPTSVDLGTVAAIRRFTFESQTLAVAHVKSTIESPGEQAKDSRLEAQRQRLSGMELTGQLEVGHGCYRIVPALVEANAILYVDPQKMIPRTQEVGREKPKRELVLNQDSKLSLQDPVSREQCQIQNELQLFQAFTRRSLCDLVSICTFAAQERWHKFLQDRLMQPPPPGFRALTIEQLLRADKQAWLRMAEETKSLKPESDGSYPMDEALDALMYDPVVLYHLLPLPASASSSSHQDASDGGKGKGRDGKGKKRKHEEAMKKLPAKLRLLMTKKGKNKCWGYNGSKGCTFSKPGGMCRRGVHICLLCDGLHPVIECPKQPSKE